MNKHIATNVLFTLALVCLFYLHVSSYWYILLMGLYLLIAFIGAYFIELNFFIYSYCKGNRNKPQIAITFDDGPNEHTSWVLNILKEENAKATFFCIGKNIRNNKEIVLRIDAEGHLVGNHSFYHENTFPLQSAKTIAAEIEKCRQLIKNVIGKYPLLFRPPFGVTDPMVAAGIRRAEVHSIGWSLRSYDTAIISPEKLLSRVERLSNGDIILFHDSGTCTASVLSQFIKNARQKGFEIVPLEQLLAIDAYEK